MFNIFVISLEMGIGLSATCVMGAGGGKKKVAFVMQHSTVILVTATDRCRLNRCYYGGNRSIGEHYILKC